MQVTLTLPVRIGPLVAMKPSAARVVGCYAAADAGVDRQRSGRPSEGRGPWTCR
jgi:hypothetical protein